MSVSLDVQKPKDSTPTMKYDVVVLGAGPYGLSVTAHLRARGLRVATFGKPMHYWLANMPEGMLLRSFWWATSLSDVEGKYSFEQYFKTRNMQPVGPTPMETFIDYGLWFQKQAVPDVDETYITMIRRKDDRFFVSLEDGRIVQSKAVVMAPGLHYYNYIPKEYAHMPSSLVSHTAEYRSFGQFAGKQVAVIGKGQAALESAALLNESGAQVSVVARGELHWVPEANMKVPAVIRKLRAPDAMLGNGWLNLLLEKWPYTLRRFPRSVVDYVMDTRHGPAGSPWLRPRLFGKVTIYENMTISRVEAANERARLISTHGKVLEVDHILLGTGYKPDIQRLTMLDQQLIDAMKAYRGSPVLDPWFQTSVPGLYFVGYSAARSFGPFYRFVAGADAAARRVASSVPRFVARTR